MQIKNSLFFSTTSKFMHYIPYYIPRKVFSLSLGHIVKPQCSTVLKRHVLLLFLL